MLPVLLALSALAAPPPLCAAARTRAFASSTGGEVFAPWERAERFQTHEPSLERLQQMIDALGARGTTVVILLLPTRPLASSYAVTDWDRERAVASYNAARDRLAAVRGVAVVDGLAIAANKPGFFFPLDHHWTPDGARAAAELAGAVTVLQPGLDGIARHHFRSDAGPTETRPGNISQQVAGVCSQDVLPPIQYTPWTTLRVDAVGLLDEQGPAEVVAVGTSNLDAAWNFTGFLSETTGVDVLNAGLGAGHALGGWLKWLSSDAAEHAPKVVVWELEVIDLDGTVKPAYPGFQQPEPWQQLIALAQGPCPSSASHTTTPLAPSTLLFDDLTPGPDVVLRLRIPGPRHAPLTVRLTGQDGAVVEQPIAQWRTPAPGPYIATTLVNPHPKRVELLTPQPGGSVEAWLCPAALK